MHKGGQGIFLSVFLIAGFPVQLFIDAHPIPAT